MLDVNYISKNEEKEAKNPIFSTTTDNFRKSEEKEEKTTCKINIETVNCGEAIPQNLKNIGEVVETFPIFYKNYIAEPKNEEAKARRFGVVTLLMDFWKRSYNSPPPAFEREERGKPCFKGKPLSFSISHCEGLVCCGFLKRESRGEIGIDIERVKKGLSDDEYRRLKNIYRRFFFESETSESKDECKEEFAFSFAELWTKKEALIKMTGEGFSSVGKTDALLAEILTDKVSLAEKDFILTAAISKNE